jgi:acetolactate synthase I/II/III large subunit
LGNIRRERIVRTEDFAPAFECALGSGKLAILHCIVDPQALTPKFELDAIRKQGEHIGKRRNS